MINLELDERRHEEFVRFEQQRLAPSVGEKALATTLLLNFVAPGLLDAPRPRTEYQTEPDTDPITRPMGNVALLRQIARPQTPHFSEQTAILGYSPELADAA